LVIAIPRKRNFILEDKLHGATYNTNLLYRKFKYLATSFVRTDPYNLIRGPTVPAQAKD